MLDIKRSIVMRPVLFLMFAFLGLSAAQAQSDAPLDEDYETMAFGHRIVVSTRDGETAIFVSGKEMHRDAVLGIDRQVVVGGTGVIVGQSRNGGAACEAAPFVIAFPKNGKPRFDGTVSPCGPVPKIKVSKSDIVFETRALSDRPGERWRWTPQKGLQLEATAGLVPALSDGWTALKSRKLGHPHDLLNYKDLDRLIRRAVGRKWAEIAPAMSGPGNVEYRGSLVVASACEPHFCTDRRVFILADTARRHILIAWIVPGSRNVLSSPALEAWGDDERSAFMKWDGGG